MARACTVCGNSVQAPNRKYCSDGCARAAVLKRNRDYATNDRARYTAYTRKSRAAHPETLAAWQVANRERVNECQRALKARNREQVNQAMRDYRAGNRDHVNQLKREWRARKQEQPAQ